MDDRQLPTMWKIFLAVMASGGMLGLAMPFVAAALGGARLAPGFVAASTLLGLAYAFGVYALVKGVLRAFVQKLHTLERVVAGTTPPELPGVWQSNEIDEVERSAARIVARLDAVRAEAGR